MKSTLDPALRQIYLDTDYFISDDPPLLLRVDEENGDLAILLASFGVTSAAFLTAWNPDSQRLSDAENDDLQSALLTEIELLRLNYLVGYGEQADWREYSYLILGISQEEASRLAQQFGQLAYLWIEQTGTPELISMI
jgi:hypothetical protein